MVIECYGESSVGCAMFAFVCAVIAQLVERNLAKVDVAGSSPVSRSGASMST